jgi:hypothetical protein
MNLFIVFVSIILAVIVGYNIGFKDCKNRLIRR